MGLLKLVTRRNSQTHWPGVLLGSHKMTHQQHQGQAPAHLCAQVLPSSWCAWIMATGKRSFVCCLAVLIGACDISLYLGVTTRGNLQSCGQRESIKQQTSLVMSLSCTIRCIVVKVRQMKNTTSKQSKTATLESHLSLGKYFCISVILIYWQCGYDPFTPVSEITMSAVDAL